MSKFCTTEYHINQIGHRSCDREPAGQVKECSGCYYQITAHNNEKSCLLAVIIPEDAFKREDFATDCE